MSEEKTEVTPSLKLESLRITKEYRGYNYKGPLTYEGVVTFDSPNGELKLKLTDDLSRRIIGVCADEIIHAANYQAELMRQHVNRDTSILIEAPKTEAPAKIEDRTTAETSIEDDD